MSKTVVTMIPIGGDKLAVTKNGVTSELDRFDIQVSEDYTRGEKSFMLEVLDEAAEAPDDGGSCPYTPGSAA